jgi:hypothetical protein
MPVAEAVFVLVVIGVLLSKFAARWPLLHPPQEFELSPEVFWLTVCKKLRACNEPRGRKLIIVPGPFDFPSYR